MTERDYKIIIGVLLATNVICLIIVFVLCGEIHSLQEGLSDMTDTVRTLDDKISGIEIDEETLYIEKRIQKATGFFVGVGFTMIWLISFPL